MLKHKNKVSAVLLAAGNSTRMNIKTSKQLINLFDRPLISYTIEAFELSDEISEIVLVCREQEISIIEKIIKEYKFKKVKKIADGCATRQDSAFKGLEYIGKNADYVAIHDGARALIHTEIIDSVIKEAIKNGAASAAVPVKDTLKLVDNNNFVTETLDRSLIWSVQTPQVFRLDIYKKAMEIAKAGVKDYTDDCQLLEAIGYKVKLCYSSYDNIKITTQEDIKFAESIIGRVEE